MKIILDFDDTIFNTSLMLDKFLEVFQRAGFTEKEFWNNYQKTKEKAGGFNREIFIGLFHNSNSLGENEIKKEINFVLGEMSRFIYPDFANFAKNFNKKDLILLSYGIANFQKEKIEKSKVALLLNKIIITSEDKVESFKNISQKHKNEKIFFIEDSAKQIDQVKKEFPKVIALKMERPQGRHTDTKSELADYIVNDFYQAREIIKEVCKVK